jgi:GTPase SAR1 family protein
MTTKPKVSSVVLLGTEKVGKSTLYKYARLLFSDYKYYHDKGTS